MKSNSKRPTKVAVTAELEFPFRRHYDFLEGVQAYAYENDWDLDVGPFPAQRLRHGVHFDGIVGRIDQDTYDVATANQIPIVNTWINSPVATLLPSVEVDYFAAGEMAAQHLLARGVTNFAFVGVESFRYCEAQMAGVRKVVEANACSFTFRHASINLYECWADSWEPAVIEFAPFFRKAAHPLGLVIMSDVLARFITPIIMDAGLRIPDDVAIVSTDNDRISSAEVFPTLSSIDMGCHRNGYEAAKLLDRMLKGEQVPPQTIRIPPKELVVRQSSSIFAVRDPQIATALTYMAANCTHLIGVADVVNQVEYGRDVLERRFKEYTGRTINQELVRLRVEHLKRLVVETDDAINSLHAKAGFGTVSNMYSTFRRLVGMTPAEYRQSRGDGRRWHANTNERDASL